MRFETPNCDTRSLRNANRRAPAKEREAGLNDSLRVAGHPECMVRRRIASEKQIRFRSVD
jgi:hypothetical protein